MTALLWTLVTLVVIFMVLMAFAIRACRSSYGMTLLSDAIVVDTKNLRIRSVTHSSNKATIWIEKI